MTRTNIFSGALLILLTGNLYSSPILAEKKSQPIYIESDSLHVEDKRSTSQFNGNVKFKQGDLIIHADSIQAKSKNGSISTVVIKGRPIKMNQKSAGKQVITETYYCQ